MREIRTSGSVRGEGGNPLAYSTGRQRAAGKIPYCSSILSFQSSSLRRIVRNKAISDLQADARNPVPGSVCQPHVWTIGPSPRPSGPLPGVTLTGRLQVC